MLNRICAIKITLSKIDLMLMNMIKMFNYEKVSLIIQNNPFKDPLLPFLSGDMTSL